MKIDILTLFPEMFYGPFGASIIKRAVDRGLLDIKTTNIRDFAEDKHRIVDDYPFGGGAGMVMKPEPVYKAVESLEKSTDTKVILMTPQGKVFKQDVARQLAGYDHLVFICGHYEGVDERIRPLVDLEVSIGDYVLTGGELATMVVVDAVSRLIPGVLGDEESVEEESFSTNNLLEYPHYTRPREFRGMQVPDVLVSGNHEKIKQWRLQQSIIRTLEKRPDLLNANDLGVEQKKLLNEDFNANLVPKRLKNKGTDDGGSDERS